MKRNIFKPVRNHFPLFLFFLLLNLQSFVFSIRDWTIQNLFIFISISFLYAYISVLLCHISRSAIIKCCIYLILCTLCFTNIFLHYNFNTKVSPNIIQLIIETNSVECADFIQSFTKNPSTLLLLFCIIIFIIFIYIIEKKGEILGNIINNQIIKKSLITFFIMGCFSFVFFYGTLLKCNNTFEVDEWVKKYETRPMDNISNLIYSIYDIILMKKEIRLAIKSTDDILEKPVVTHDSLNIILVIGESFNKYHSNLYGYYLNTNPILTEEKKKHRLFVFNNAYSPYNLTSKVLKNMFSTNSVGEKESWSSNPFFPTIFNLSGYDVSFWDNQYNPLSRDEFDFSLNSYIHNPKIEKQSFKLTNKKVFEFDHQLINDYFKTTKNAKSKLNFSIFHLLGQHFAYYNRFPHDKGNHDYFSIDSIHPKNNVPTSEMRQIIADYANATRYNDYVIGLLINFFKSQNTILLYISDHGEEVYDYRNKYGRSWENPIPRDVIKYQYEIPFFIWCSDLYIKNHPETIKYIMSSVNKLFSSDNICHLLFSIASIKTKYYNQKRDILNPKYKTPKIIINDMVEVTSLDITSRE